MEKNLIFGGFSYTEGAEEGEFPAKGRRRKSFETSNCLCGALCFSVAICEIVLRIESASKASLRFEA